MKTSAYCILQKLSDGNYLCVDEVESIEDAQIRLMLLEADSPGNYVAYNLVSGKRVQNSLWATYVS